MKFTYVQVLSDKWWVLPLSFCVALAVTPLLRRLAQSRGIVDRPDGVLKPHAKPTPYLGGVAVCAGLLTGLVAYLFIIPDIGGHWRNICDNLSRGDLLRLMMPHDRDPAYLPNPLWKLLGVLLAVPVIVGLGLLDDLYKLRPLHKVLGQVLAAVILLLSGVASQVALVVLLAFVKTPPDYLVLSLSTLMCLIIVIGATNAANLLDGLDGLCGGVTAIITIGFLAMAIWLAMWGLYPKTDGLRVTLCLAMSGAVLGFLPYNLPPASIFLGDAGSMLLGFFVAMMMCLFCREGNPRWFIASLVVFSLPILDTSLAAIRRLLAGKSIFEGDRSHLYDQLIDRGMKVRQVVGLMYLLAAATTMIGVTVSVLLRIRQAVPIYLLLLIMVIGVFVLIGMVAKPTVDKHAIGGDMAATGGDGKLPADTKLPPGDTQA